ncbi:hypothetical protein Syun_025373 [Stephania yunnanensis]|uniref:Uncharacterized protein n=1 Tax=Stephania yunnanensis TaxID=152371 RepID=A0AAP0EX42_9MAGN
MIARRKGRRPVKQSSGVSSSKILSGGQDLTVKSLNSKNNRFDSLPLNEKLSNEGQLPTIQPQVKGVHTKPGLIFLTLIIDCGVQHGQASHTNKGKGKVLEHFLSQLPVSVFREVNDSSFKNWEERGRFITKRLCELDSSLEDKVQWKFPEVDWTSTNYPENVWKVIDERGEEEDGNHRRSSSRITEDGNMLGPYVHRSLYRKSISAISNPRILSSSDGVPTLLRFSLINGNAGQFGVEQVLISR